MKRLISTINTFLSLIFWSSLISSFGTGGGNIREIPASVSIVVDTRKNINIINAVSANDAEGISGVLRAIINYLTLLFNSSANSGES